MDDTEADGMRLLLGEIQKAAYKSKNDAICNWKTAAWKYVPHPTGERPVINRGLGMVCRADTKTRITHGQSTTT